MKREDIHTEHPTFNGLNRQAMMFGIPLQAVATCLFSGMMFSLPMTYFLGWRALLFLLLPLPFLAFLRTICANDDQALRIYYYEVMYFLRRRNAKMFNGTNTILATKFGRQQSDYQRFIEECVKSSTGAVRFSASDLPTRYKQHR
ncbi:MULTISPECIES: VirB3 family type IV secretion system protein [unclassified Neisseria]|uniref:VirB3 family type IV secretion system protein n=1 Tax=unclassified Neisseria TaxID=2623750 RepID=UPI00266635E5|nr:MULTISPECIES: VirB3 family type IV secretion system protein [unclassified Neisseria]MDO1509548.1 VirB3 family type IV secretion system protein [Neisseria sp. MVDL19-042950]MDO1515680.1 VirB3 family type IV secretion system protein [Neisseria sp. MVDL18-041461]MDO1563496.1 VirB3 family type IV secretion system protein [Neisseria sp. MVDL20-010259]